jgi:hypothetical protein
MRGIIFGIIFFVIFSIESYSQYTDTLQKLVATTNREKISIFTYRYIDSLDNTRRKIFTLTDIFGKNTRIIDNYNIEVFVPFNVLRTFVLNPGYIFSQLSTNVNINTFNTDLININDAEQSPLYIIDNNSTLTYSNSFTFISVEIPFYVFDKKKKIMINN